MPKFEIVEQAEFEKRPKETPGRNQYLAEYQAILSQIPIGKGAVLRADEGEKKQTIKNRLNHAARTLNLNVRIVRAPANSVKFQVVGPLEPGEEVDTEVDDEEESTEEVAAVA